MREKSDVSVFIIGRDRAREEEAQPEDFIPLRGGIYLLLGRWSAAMILSSVISARR